MKILVVGEARWSWYQQAFSDALVTLGHESRVFGWSKFFFQGEGQRAKPVNMWARLQNRVVGGPRVLQVNRELVQAAVAARPDVLLVYNGTHILPSTLRRIKKLLPGTLLAQYSNDNPFSPTASPLLWRHLRRSIPIYDTHFVYRHSNQHDVMQRGGANTHLLRSYYVPEMDFRRDLSKADERFVSDVVFVGHYEDDGRLQALEAVARLNVRFHLFGSTWYLAERQVGATSPLRKFFPIKPLFHDDYRKAISGAKIVLNFLSKLNGDTYTRRNFEIPAMGSFMLSQHSDDLGTLYEEGKEAEFFRSRDELVEKIVYYLSHEDERDAIARRGRERLLRDGHDIVSRARQFVSVVESLGQGVKPDAGKD